MGATTEIAWTDATFNPWWGCFKISPGCKHCYADAFAHRLGLKVWGQDADHRRFGDAHWREPEKWNRDALKAGVRRRVFCASMADVFEGRTEDDADRARLFALIEATPGLDWLLLTKRPENMIKLAPAGWGGHWPRNVWAGCTVEDQEALDRRVDVLRKVPAVVRFVSAEPLLGPLHFDDGLPGIHWVICGAESGHGARPMSVEWARSIRDQCKSAGVAFFFKQFADARGNKTHTLDEIAAIAPDLAIREFPRGQ